MVNQVSLPAAVPRGDHQPKVLRSWRSVRRGVVWSVLVVVIAYLALVVTFNLRTPAWENDDEAGHMVYTEYFVQHHMLPPIAEASGDESHQGPLYYVLLGEFQTTMGIPAFQPQLPPTAPHGPSVPYELSHRYTPEQHQQAVWLHTLRFFSIFCGLLTVLAAYLTGWLLTRRTSVAAAMAATVAVWPKFLVISAAVTNSALVDAVCACALPCWVWWHRSRSPRVAAVTGGVLGAAVLTQVTALPLTALLLLSMLVAAIIRRDWLSPLLAFCGSTVVCGWWFIRNAVLYGDPLATMATDANMRATLPGLNVVRSPPSLSLAVIRHMIPYAEHSFWYSAGWDQLLLPRSVDDVLWIFAGVSILATLSAYRGLHLAFVAGVIASIVAWLLIIRSATHGQGRYLLTGVTAWATLLVTGITRIGPRRQWQPWVWPAVFLILDGYLILTTLIPYGGS